MDEVGQAVKPCPYGDDLPGIRRFQTKKGDFEDVSAPRSSAVVQNLRPLACSSQVTRSLREQSGYIRVWYSHRFCSADFFRVIVN